MPISWNEIRDRSQIFAREWKDTESERAESQSFWNAFFEVFGLSRKRVAIFEKQVKQSKAGGVGGNRMTGNLARPLHEFASEG